MRSAAASSSILVFSVCAIFLGTLTDVLSCASAAPTAADYDDSTSSNANNDDTVVVSKLVIDLIEDPDMRKIPAGYSISNASLDFGRVESFTVVSNTIQLEWPSPPGTENGQAGVVIRTKCSDESLISFVIGTVMNDGVRSSVTMTVQYHPQRHGNDVPTEGTTVMLVGNLVAFRIPVRGVPLPSAHQLSALSAYGRATVLHPYEPWTFPLALYNPTDQPYHLHGFETTSRHLRVMFVDQHDQVDGQRKNWVIPPGTMKPLGSLGVLRFEEEAFYGFFYLRLRNHGSFAFFYNFTVQPRRPRVATLGTHMVMLRNDDVGQTNGTSTATGSARDLATMETGAAADWASTFADDATQQEHRRGELVVRPVEVFNYQTKPLHILDAFLKRSVPSTEAKQRQESAYPTYQWCRAIDSPSATDAVPSSGTAPCMRVVPQLDTIIPPGTRGVAAVVILNLTDCLIDHRVGPTTQSIAPQQEEPDAVGSTSATFRRFHAAQQLTAEVQIILAGREAAQRTMDVTMTGWAIAGGVLPVRKRGSQVQRMEQGFLLALPTLKESKVEPLDLLVYSAFRFPLKHASPSVLPVKGMALRAADSWEVPGMHRVLNIGQVSTTSVADLRASLGGDAHVSLVTLQVPIKPNNTRCRRTQSTAAKPPRCIPDTVETNVHVAVLLKPLILSHTLDVGVTDEAALWACETTDPATMLLHPDARTARCHAVTVPLRRISLGVHAAPTAASKSQPTILHAMSLRLTNPHNISVVVSEMTFSPLLTAHGRATQTSPFVRIAAASLQKLEMAFPVGASPIDGVATLTPGAGAAIQVELVCDAMPCEGVADGRLTIRAVLRVPGRQAVVQETSLPVSFGVLSDVHVALQAPPTFAWSDRRFSHPPAKGIDGVDVDVAVDGGTSAEVPVVDRNITIRSHLAKAIAMPPAQCTVVAPGVSDRLQVQPHPSFAVIWQRQTLPAGPFEGPVATVRYFPTRRAANLRVPTTSAVGGGARVGTSMSGSRRLFEGMVQQSVPTTHASAIDASFLHRGTRYSTNDGTSDDMLRSTSRNPCVDADEINEFANNIGDWNEQMDQCRFSLFPQPQQQTDGAGEYLAGPNHKPLQWSTLLSGQRGMTSFLTSVVDFGSVSPSTSSSNAFAYVSVVNAQPTAVSIRPLLWSASSARLPASTRALLRDSIRQAFSAYRNLADQDASDQRDKTASFRIPDDVWDAPSTAFELRGNASLAAPNVVLQPYQRVTIGPIAYHPQAGAVRAVDRDVLLLRNNHSGLDAVLVVGKVGRPVVFLGTLHASSKWAPVVAAAGRPGVGAEAVPLPGEALSDPLATVNALQWNVTADVMGSWSPRPSGFPSWLDLYRHWQFAGSDDHAMQLSQRFPYDDAVEEGWLPLPLRPTHLRRFVVRNEFDGAGKVAELGAPESPQATSTPAATRHEFAPPILARLPIYFSTTFELINKGSFHMNISSLTLGNGKCQDGELRIVPCLLPVASRCPNVEGGCSSNEDDDPAAAAPLEGITEEWAILLDTLNVSVVHSHSHVVIMPRHAFSVLLLWMPRWFHSAAHTEVVLTHGGGSSMVRYPVTSTLPSDSRLAAELRFTNMKPFAAAAQHAAVSTLLTVVVAVVGLAVGRIVWTGGRTTRGGGGAPDMEGLAKSQSAQSLLQTPITRGPGSTTTTAPAARGGATKAQMLLAKKARKEAWDLYHNQQKLQNMQNQLTNGAQGAAAATQGTSQPSHLATSTNDDAGADEPTAVSSSAGSSRSSSAPPTSGNPSSLLPPGSDDPPPTQDVPPQPSAQSPPHPTYDAQRQQRHLRREQLDVRDDEENNRGRLVTEQLAFIGQALLEWNSSEQVRKYHELKALERLQQQAAVERAAAAAVAAQEAARLEAEQRKREAEERRRHAEEIIRKSEKNTATAAVAVATGAAAPAVASASTALPEKRPREPRRNFQACDRVRIPVLPRAPESIGDGVDNVGTTTPPDRLHRHPSFDNTAVGGSGSSTTTGGGTTAVFRPSPVDASPPSSNARTSGSGSGQRLQPGLAGTIPSSSFLAPATIDDETISTTRGNSALDASYAEVELLLQQALRDQQSAPQTATAPVGSASSLLARRGMFGANNHHQGGGGEAADVHSTPGKASSLRQRLASSQQLPTAGRPLASVDEGVPEHKQAKASASSNEVRRGIMGRASTPTEELLPQRLPSDFAFEEGVAHQTTGAAVGDYNAFFGLQLQFTAPPPAPAAPARTAKPTTDSPSNHSMGSSPRLTVSGGSPVLPRSNATGGLWGTSPVARNESQEAEDQGTDQTTAGPFDMFGGRAPAW